MAYPSIFQPSGNTQLAINEGIETVCIDEHLGRRVARLTGLRVTGSLGILIRAKREGHSLCISDAVSRMREAGVFLNDRVIEAVLYEVGELSGVICCNSKKPS